MLEGVALIEGYDPEEIKACYCSMIKRVGIPGGLSARGQSIASRIAPLEIIGHFETVRVSTISNGNSENVFLRFMEILKSSYNYKETKYSYSLKIMIANGGIFSTCDFKPEGCTIENIIKDIEDMVDPYRECLVGITLGIKPSENCFKNTYIMVFLN